MAAGPEQIEERYIENTFATPDDSDWDAARKEVSRKIEVQLNTVLAKKDNQIKVLDTLFTGCNCEAFSILENSAQSGSRTYAFVYTLAVSLAEYARNIDDGEFQATIIDFIGKVNTAYKTKLTTLFWGKPLPNLVNITWLLSTQVPLLIQLFEKILSALRENHDTPLAKKKLLVSFYLSIRCMGFSIELKGGNYVPNETTKTIENLLADIRLCYNTLLEETETLQEKQEISEPIPILTQTPEKDHYTAAEYYAVILCFKDSISIDTALETIQQNLEILITMLQLNSDLSDKIKKQLSDELTKALRNVEQRNSHALFENLNSIQAILVNEDERLSPPKDPLSPYSPQLFFGDPGNRGHERKVAALQDPHERISADTIKKEIDTFISTLETFGAFTYHSCARQLKQEHQKFNTFYNRRKEEEEKVRIIRIFCAQAKGLIQTKRNSQVTKSRDEEFEKFSACVAKIEMLIPEDLFKSTPAFSP